MSTIESFPGPFEYHPEKVNLNTGIAYSFGIKVNPNNRPGKSRTSRSMSHLFIDRQSFHVECETRSVTPTSEFADLQVDIDEEFASVGIQKFTSTTTKTTTQRVKTTVQKRA
jgi:hypothetical protein